MGIFSRHGVAYAQAPEGEMFERRAKRREWLRFPGSRTGRPGDWRRSRSLEIWGESVGVDLKSATDALGDIRGADRKRVSDKESARFRAHSAIHVATKKPPWVDPAGFFFGAERVLEFERELVNFSIRTRSLRREYRLNAALVRAGSDDQR